MADWDEIKKEKIGGGPWTIGDALWSSTTHEKFDNLPGDDYNTRRKIYSPSHEKTMSYDGRSEEYTKENVLNSIRSLFIEIVNPVTAWADKYFDGLEITSMYRSFDVNTYIGSGEVRSQHTLGQAIDIRCKNWACKSSEIFNYIVDQSKQGKMMYDQMIWEFPNLNETSWIHVSYLNPDVVAIREEEGRMNKEDSLRNFYIKTGGGGNRMVNTIADRGGNLKYLYQSEGNSKKKFKKFSGVYMDDQPRRRNKDKVSPEWVYPSVMKFFSNSNSGRWENKDYTKYDKDEWEGPPNTNYVWEKGWLYNPLEPIPIQTITSLYKESGINPIRDYLDKIPYLNPPTTDDLLIRPNLMALRREIPSTSEREEVISNLNLDKIIGEVSVEVTKTLFGRAKEGTITAVFTGFVNGETYTVKVEEQNIHDKEARKNTYNNFIDVVRFELGGIELTENSYLFTYENKNQNIIFGYYYESDEYYRIPVYNQ